MLNTPTLEEALATANDSEFGLTAGIKTQSLSRATHFRPNATAGRLMVNLPIAGMDYLVPSSGRGAPFGSHEQGQYAIELYKTVKTTYPAGGAPA
jgi:aldehyde dehydrogenase (NAD+)